MKNLTATLAMTLVFLFGITAVSNAAIWTVKSGDTPSKIGRKLNISSRNVMQLAGITDARKLRIGTVINTDRLTSNNKLAECASKVSERAMETKDDGNIGSAVQGSKGNSKDLLGTKVASAEIDVASDGDKACLDCDDKESGSPSSGDQLEEPRSSNRNQPSNNTRLFYEPYF